MDGHQPHQIAAAGFRLAFDFDVVAFKPFDEFLQRSDMVLFKSGGQVQKFVQSVFRLAAHSFGKKTSAMQNTEHFRIKLKRTHIVGHVHQPL